MDADGVAFRAASAVQRGIRWDDNVYTLEADGDAAADVFRDAIERYTAAADADAVILAYSCPTRHYFRHDLLPSYKANRKSMPPLCLHDLKEWSKGQWDSRTKPGLEADDVLGILATHPRLVPGRKVIVSHDKDLQQIPGEHLNAATPGDGVFRVHAAYAHRFFWTQVLTGDTTDNYAGCPGIGAKRAEAILDGARKGDQWHYAEAILKAFEKAGLTAEDMAVQYNVARILHHHHYDFKRKEPILWTAP